MAKPPYDRGSSDGCSVPQAMRLAIPQETEEQRAVCADHDEAYYYGGSRRRRAIADAELLLGLLRMGLEVELAEQYHTAVRIFGKRHWDQGRGLYSDDPPGTVPAGKFWSDPWKEME